MIRSQTLERSRGGTRTLDKSTFVGQVTDLLTAHEQDAWPRPQSFLVEQTGNWTLPTHFHMQNQFQLFVGGGGTIGSHTVEPGHVHYASAHSAYGPLISEAQGIAYLTLRLVSDTGAWYLPEQREHLELRRPKRQKHAAAGGPIGPEALRALAIPCTEAVMPCDATGLAVWRIRLPPHACAAAPADAAQGGGRFYVLMQGGLQLPGDTLQGLATTFVSREDTIDLVAGSDGAEVMVLQFPSETLTPSTTPPHQKET